MECDYARRKITKDHGEFVLVTYICPECSSKRFFAREKNNFVTR